MKANWGNWVTQNEEGEPPLVDTSQGTDFSREFILDLRGEIVGFGAGEKQITLAGKQRMDGEYGVIGQGASRKTEHTVEAAASENEAAHAVEEIANIFLLFPTMADANSFARMSAANDELACDQANFRLAKPGDNLKQAIVRKLLADICI